MFITHDQFIDLYTIPGYFGMAGLGPSVTQRSLGCVDNKAVFFDQRCQSIANAPLHTDASDLGMT